MQNSKKNRVLLPVKFSAELGLRLWTRAFKKALSLSFFPLALVVTFAMGCQPSDNSSNNQGTDSVCVTNPSLCNGQIYQNNPGFTGYPMGTVNGGVVYYNNGWISAGQTPFYVQGANAYLCNCPTGSVPTYNTYAGLGCVQANIVGSGYVAYSWGPNNNQWLNIPQISNYTGYSNNGCYNGVVQSCLLSSPNTCAVGSVCRPTSAGSNIGICSR